MTMSTQSGPRESSRDVSRYALRPQNRLKLVRYEPPGGAAHACAAIWREGNHIHLVAPLSRSRDGVRDPKPYVRRFPESLAAWQTFEEAMAWFDALCYSASDPRQVASACREHPELKLRCTAYDGTDADLVELSELMKASKRGAPLPAGSVRDCLLELLKEIIKTKQAFVEAQIDIASPGGPDVANIELPLDRQVLVTLLMAVGPADLVPSGVLAHHRMMDGHHGYSQCLLVAPGVALREPMYLTRRVTVVGLDPGQITSALAEMAKR